MGTSAPEAPDLARLPVRLASCLRRRGVPVSVGATVELAQALEVVGIAERERVYWAARATMVKRREHFGLFDEAFAECFGGAWPLRPHPVPVSVTVVLDDEEGGEGDGEGEKPDGPLLTVRFSRAEVLRHKDFADYSPEELAEAQALMAAMSARVATRRSRRWRRAGQRRGRLDVPATYRASLATEGEALRRHWRRRRQRPRRLVLLLDVSGSMEAYSRALLRFVQAAVVGGRQVEAFALGTRLTRLTHELSERDPDVALARAAESVVDFGGGTRLGEGLTRFNERWGVRGMARGAVVVVLSDGWDRGDPEQLGEAMARLHRVAHRVVWVNPLKATAGYQPLVRGMAAALPFVDEFVEGHTLARLEDLMEVIAR